MLSSGRNPRAKVAPARRERESERRDLTPNSNCVPHWWPPRSGQSGEVVRLFVVGQLASWACRWAQLLAGCSCSSGCAPEVARRVKVCAESEDKEFAAILDCELGQCLGSGRKAVSFGLRSVSSAAHLPLGDWRLALGRTQSPTFGRPSARSGDCVLQTECCRLNAADCMLQLRIAALQRASPAAWDSFQQFSAVFSRFSPLFCSSPNWSFSAVHGTEARRRLSAGLARTLS